MITLLSDYGSNTSYLASLKAKLSGLLPQVTVIDISHQLPPFDLLQASYLLKNVMPDCKNGTVHIVAIDTNLNVHKNLLVGTLDNQWVICADNGFFSMLSDKWTDVFRYQPQLFEANTLNPQKNIFTEVAQNLLQQSPVETFLEAYNTMLKVEALKPAMVDKQVRATVVHVDGYQNVVLNFTKSDFDELIGDKSFRIFYRRRESIGMIHQDYSAIKEGDVVAVFNENNFLELAINKGSTKALLGLRVGDNVIIEWYD